MVGVLLHRHALMPATGRQFPDDLRQPPVPKVDLMEHHEQRPRLPPLGLFFTRGVPIAATTSSEATQPVCVPKHDGPLDCGNAPVDDLKSIPHECSIFMLGSNHQVSQFVVHDLIEEICLASSHRSDSVVCPRQTQVALSSHRLG